MQILDLHPWDVSLSHAREIQNNLKNKIHLDNSFKIKNIKRIAAADISFFPKGKYLFASMVICYFPTLSIIGAYHYKAQIGFPYVPGYLSFREAPVLLNLIKSVDEPFDLLLCDGQGIAHPRGLGLASHLGLFLDLPTIGCAKTLLVGKYKEPDLQKGCYSTLIYQNKTIGTVLRTRAGVKPVFISPGHKISIKKAHQVVLTCCPFYRIPEPLRLAHFEVKRLRLGKDKYLEENGYKQRKQY
jgi:deoxyribonuclease V